MEFLVIISDASYYCVADYLYICDPPWTVLVSKNKGFFSPAKYGRITMASTLVRGFYKVLAKSMNRLIALDE